MDKLLYFEQTTQDANRCHWIKSCNKKKPPWREGGFFCFYAVYGNTKLVNIITILGTIKHQETLKVLGALLIIFILLLEMDSQLLYIYEQIFYKKYL